MNTPAEACWHCSERLPQSRWIYASVGGQSRAFCCHGCEAAAEWIDRLGLADYYRLRTAPAQTPRDVRGRDAWRRPEIQQHVVRDLDDGRTEVMLVIDGVRCTGCAWLIERSLMALRGVERVSINAAARRARITWRPEITPLTSILENLGRIGYTALPLDARLLDDSRRRESRAALKRLLVAAIGAMQAMMFAAVLYFGAVDSRDVSTRSLFHWLGFLVATPVVLYSAQPFFVGATRALRAGHLGMDVPIAFSIAAIYLASTFEAARGSVDVYFDSVSMFVLFLLAARYVEMHARHSAGELTDALARMTPALADRRRSDGSIETVGVHELQSGDHVLVTEGGAGSRRRCARKPAMQRGRITAQRRIGARGAPTRRSSARRKHSRGRARRPVRHSRGRQHDAGRHRGACGACVDRTSAARAHRRAGRKALRGRGAAADLRDRGRRGVSSIRRAHLHPHSP